MNAEREVIEKPLSTEELAVRYRAMCEDPCLTNVPGKLELDVWGRMVMSPPGTYHGMVQGRLCERLGTLGGRVFGETPIATRFGLFVADAAWGSHEFIRSHRRESPFMTAPEICVEVVSPSNSIKELEEKRTGYFSAGAEEVWFLYLKSKRLEFYGRHGLLEHSRFGVDLTGIFDEA
jgi:Uma2 family endonuclease